MPNPPYPPVDLSADFEMITEYLGLSMDSWKAGFHTKLEVFEWAGTCHFFDPGRFRSEGSGIKKVKPQRTMYAEFVEWANKQPRSVDVPTPAARQAEIERIRTEALVYFKKQDDFETVTGERSARSRLKEGFNGSTVRDWCHLGEHWKGVKVVMDGVRRRLHGDEGVLKFLDKEGQEELKKIVLEVQQELKVADTKSLSSKQQIHSS